MAGASSLRANFLALPGLRGMVASPWLPLGLQILMLLAMGGLAWLGGTTPVPVRGKEILILQKTNLTTLAVWGLWWPGMILGALVAGRLWCAVCPMELMNRVGHALGRRLGSARMKLGAFLRAGWVILFLYLVMQLLVAGLALHRMPPYTAWMLATMSGLALGSGLLIREERSFCKGFCPAQALLSVYGRFTPLQLDKVDASTCEVCTTRECIQPGLREAFDARSCPSSLRPFDRTASDGCVLCLQCVKVCPKENMGWGLTQSKSPSLPLLKPYEAGFVMVAAGFVAHELLGEIAGLETLFHAVPKWLNHFAPTVGFGWFEALWFLGLFPLAFWTLVALLARALGHRQSIPSLFLAAATGAAPFVALAHAGKATAKLLGWVGYLPFALKDPVGLMTMNRILAGQGHAPKALLGTHPLGWALTLALLAGAIRNFRRRGDASESGSPKALLGGRAMAFALFLFVGVAWIFA